MQDKIKDCSLNTKTLLPLPICHCGCLRVCCLFGGEILCVHILQKAQWGVLLIDGNGLQNQPSYPKYNYHSALLTSSIVYGDKVLSASHRRLYRFGGGSHTVISDILNVWSYLNCKGWSEWSGGNYGPSYASISPKYFYTLRTGILAKLVPKYLQKPGYANAKHKHE